MKDLHDNIDIAPVVLPKLFTTGVTGTAEIDLVGYDSAELEVTAGAPGDTLGAAVKFTVTTTHADDDGTGSAGAYENVEADDVLGVTPAEGVCLTIDADAEASQVYRFGYVGGKRFVKVLVTAVGTHTTGTIVGVNVVKGHPLEAPTA